jgi:alpha-mannosidase
MKNINNRDNRFLTDNSISSKKELFLKRMIEEIEFNERHIGYGQVAELSNKACRRLSGLKLMLLLFFIFFNTCIYSQQAYFVDGYHGGIYGHYPIKWYTAFITDQLLRHKDWKISLEIEPETWDTVQVVTPNAYFDFKKMVNTKQIEYTNPTYAQPYCYNISGESIIRQFQYGMAKLKKHFPNIDFYTYSCEEPCFTSCLPQILKLLGCKYAVLKCPDTCWGGYTEAHGGEFVNWIGPDGTSILIVPRYSCEKLEKNSTWQTTAWNNSSSYLNDCYNTNILHPVGMCLQDAGWKNGPWIGSGADTKNKSIYVRWRDYFEKVSTGKNYDRWRLSQEDLHVNLMWGSQVLQKIAQEVRSSENKMIIAEKMSAMANIENKYTCSQKEMDEAWRTLMLAQHHDSWIVPYNNMREHHETWADAIKQWTERTISTADNTIEDAMQSFAGKDNYSDTHQAYVRVFNTLGIPRNESVNIRVPEEFANSKLELSDCQNRKIGYYTEKDESDIRLFFKAQVPPFGYATYRISKIAPKSDTIEPTDKRTIESKREYTIENDMYKIVFDLSKGGIIKHLIVKKEGNRDYVDKVGKYGFGELRGYFYDEGKFHSSTESPAEISIVRNNAYKTSIKIESTIASNPFVQIVTIGEGQKRIDFDLSLNWKKNVGIGEYQETDWRNNRRAYYDSRYKLNVLFPVSFHSSSIYKDAPFDVCKSRLDDTFFNTWDHIKHNIILHWVDLCDKGGDYSMALLSDHTTSYAYGGNYPLGLTLQYSGIGLWGYDYKITAPSHVRYAIIPHRGKWDEANISEANDCWNEPLLCSFYRSADMDTKSYVDLRNTGYQISTTKIDNEGILLRLYNADGGDGLKKVRFLLPADSVEAIDLNGQCIEKYKISKLSGTTELNLSIPRFGIKTLLLKYKT